MIRGPYSHEPGRLECILLGMQGLGGPGVHQWQMSYFGMPRAESLDNFRYFNPTLSEHLRVPVQSSVDAWATQNLPKTLIHEAILHGPLKFTGTGAQNAETEDQFIEYEFPLPKEEGGSELHMIWTDTPCRITCWNHGNWIIESHRHESIEFMVAQHPWLENDCLYADIILPANTTMEVDDCLTNVRQGPPFQTCTLQDKAIEPLGESKSDYEIVLAVADKLGLKEKITQGKSVRDLQKEVFECMYGSKYMTWEEFEEKKYVVYPTAEDWESDPPGLREFYDDPKASPLKTPSGLLEFYSERLATHFPHDEERPPIPKWVERGVTHDERISSERADLFPLVLMSNHPRWRTHAQGDDCTWARETPTGKVLGPDNYNYEPRVAAPHGRGGARHRARRDRQDLQRARHRARRRLRVGAPDAGRRLHRPRRPSRPHHPGQGRPRRRHQHHRPERPHLPPVLRPGHQRLSGRRAEDQAGGVGDVASGLPRGLRERVRPRGRTALRRLGGRGR